MATNRPRFSVTFTDDSYKKIKKYQNDHNISTQSKAVARLVEIAISEIESGNGKKSPSTTEAAPGDIHELLPIMTALYAAMNQLNDQGQEKVLEYADDLVSSGKYIKSDPAGLGKEA